jgi:hypothetical protein
LDAQARTRDAAGARRLTVSSSGLHVLYATPRRRTTCVRSSPTHHRWSASRRPRRIDAAPRRRGPHAHAVPPRRWVNAGASAGHTRTLAAFWARWSDDVEFRRTPYDVERAARELLDAAGPRRSLRRGERPAPVAREATAWFGVPAWDQVAARKPHGSTGRLLRRGRERRSRALRRGRCAVGGESGTRGRRSGRRPTRDPPRPRGARVRRSRSSEATCRARGGRVLRVPARRARGGGDRRPAARPRHEVSSGLPERRPRARHGLALPLVDACVQEVDLDAGRILVEPGFAADS